MKPNIMFVLVDDLGWKDLRCTGSDFYETPNIDRIAAEGVRFTQAYATCPVCSPSRASVLTGKYPARLGITDWIDHDGKHHPCRGYLVDAPYQKYLPLTEKSIASTLRENGYHTWHIGKWHLGDEPYYPECHGFDVNAAGCFWGWPRNGYFSPWGNPRLEDSSPAGTYLTDRLADEAIALIRNKQDDRPFFLNFWTYQVHIPLQAKPEKIAKFQRKAEAMGLTQRNPFEEGEPFPTNYNKHLRVTRRRFQSDPVYAAMIESLDENIGRILAALEETGELDNTLIIFTSDNGGLATAEGAATCNAPLAEGKGWMYEGGTREPLLMRWGGHIAPGSTCDTPVTGTDFYPTLLEAAGIAPMPEQHCDGISLMPLLAGQKPCQDRPLFWHYPHYGNQGGTPGSSVRLGDYKLIEFFEDGRLELYDLKNDPGETRNLAATLPDTTHELAQRLRAWRASIHALLPARA